MATLTIPLDESLHERIEQFSWVNWSEVAREALKKREIFEIYIRTGKISDQDMDFCENIDWHPVDELPLQEKFIKEIKSAKQELPERINSISDIFK